MAGQVFQSLNNVITIFSSSSKTYIIVLSLMILWYRCFIVHVDTFSRRIHWMLYPIVMSFTIVCTSYVIVVIAHVHAISMPHSQFPCITLKYVVNTSILLFPIISLFHALMFIAQWCHFMITWIIWTTQRNTSCLLLHDLITSKPLWGMHELHIAIYTPDSQVRPVSKGELRPRS